VHGNQLTWHPHLQLLNGECLVLQDAKYLIQVCLGKLQCLAGSHG
jgi:hypothetical protein